MLLAVSCATAVWTAYDVVLQNAADPGVSMPLAGLGMPCGPLYSCSASSYNGTRTFLAAGGRRTDSADSYAAAEPGIGLAMRQWMAETGSRRSELFIGSKIGPGGACFPLGFNESIAQAKAIIGYYNELPIPHSANSTNITQLDTLLVHWPVNGPAGKIPCNLPAGARSIPTTDPACDMALPTFDEKGCRISTWRGMVYVWKTLRLVRSIGVSNFNSTMMQDLADAGLPLPAINQINWQPGFLRPQTAFVPYPHAETFGSLLFWCQLHGVVVNGYSPFGGHGSTKYFKHPDILAVASRHNVSTAQVILRWNVQLGVPMNPMATNPAYQLENLDVFSFSLSEVEMFVIGSLPALPTPTPHPAIVA
jgi:diketogulonate reductase-like aldo/keto reductase